MKLTASPSSVRPTRVRYLVVAFCLGLAMVTYLDRACIATLAPHLMEDLSLSKEQMSAVYSAFALAYATFEIPTAWWATRCASPATSTVPTCCRTARRSDCRLVRECHPRLP
jgi:sugar phosphate permease